MRNLLSFSFENQFKLYSGFNLADFAEEMFRKIRCRKAGCKICVVNTFFFFVVFFFLRQVTV